MAYELQKQIHRDLGRIPRGLKGSLQNQFRFAFCFFYSQGKSFDARVELAANEVRKRDGSFVPQVLPLSGN